MTAPERIWVADHNHPDGTREYVRADLASVPAQVRVSALRDAGYDTPTDPRDEVIARLVEALEFYADIAAWTQPPVKTYEGLISIEYENHASKVKQDRGTKARAALAAVKTVQK